MYDMFGNLNLIGAQNPLTKKSTHLNSRQTVTEWKNAPTVYTTYQQTSDFACFRLILAVFAGSAHVCFVGKNNVTFILTLVQKSGCGTNNYPHTIPNILRRTRTVSSGETIGEFKNAPTRLNTTTS